MNWKEKKKGIIDVTLVIGLIAIVGLCFSFIDKDNYSFCENVGPYSFIIGILVFFIFWLRTYLNQNLQKDRIQTNLEFFKILLPTSLSILTFTWLLSSGYLNLRTENLKRDIHNLEQRIEQFKRASTKLYNNNKNIFLKNLYEIVIPQSLEQYLDTQSTLIRKFHF